MTVTILAKSLYLFLIVEVVFSVNGTPFMFVLIIEYYQAADDARVQLSKETTHTSVLMWSPEQLSGTQYYYIQSSVYEVSMRLELHDLFDYHDCRYERSRSFTVLG